MGGDVFGVVDIGSNTVHLLVATSDGVTQRRIDDRSVFLRLGADLELTGGITEGKVRDAALSVLELTERAEALGAREVRLLATQAVRAASNRAEVVRAIESACGLPVSVLDPEREAYFAVLGAGLTKSPPGPHLVVDSGGASTQIALADGEILLAVHSIPIGSGRLATRFSQDPPRRSELLLMKARIASLMEPAVEAVLKGRPAPGNAVVVGGAPRRVARVVSQAGAPTDITIAQAHAAVDFLVSQPAEAIVQQRQIELTRVPMARAGALILDELMRATGLAVCTVSPYGIREGAIIDAARTARWHADGGARNGEPAPARR